jgi:hypothetical protein
VHTMNVTTKSGAEYIVSIQDGKLPLAERVHPEKWPAKKCVAIFRDRIPLIESAVEFRMEGEFFCGYNSAGNRTFRIIPGKIMLGMVLFSIKGFLSTEIIQFN